MRQLDSFNTRLHYGPLPTLHFSNGYLSDDENSKSNYFRRFFIFKYFYQHSIAATTATTTIPATATRITPTTSTISEVNRKQAFEGWIQEVALEASKQYNDLEFFLDDLIEDLRPEM